MLYEMNTVVWSACSRTKKLAMAVEVDAKRAAFTGNHAGSLLTRLSR